MAGVSIRSVKKSYGDVEVIHGIDCEIADGEFIVILGPSGCGKSTLLRMIAGLEEITAGEIAIGARVVNDLEPKDRNIAMVFQNYALYPHMTVYDNMAYGLRIRGMSKAEIDMRVKKAASILELDGLLARKPRQLSGGQRQRVAMGRALVREPAVFLFDEPLSNLDAKLRVQTRAEIARLHQATGTTFVYVTHDQIEAMTMGDRIAVLNGGLIQQLGAPQELYDTPANLFVAGFIGSPAMSFLSARLVQVDGGAAVVFAGTGVERAPRVSGALAGAGTAEGRAVVVGVRPESLRLASDEAAVALTGTVELVEHLGNEQLVHVSTPAALALESSGRAREDGALERPRVVARMDASKRVSLGERV
ncbi:MAG TPA: sn-glycerol-3-phosphate ABC transporter ATP-binding protein UgpC, partial [Alphaproteobacteria bacterium]